ncbi:protein SHORTAGE IN CHIASMATA 1 homolog [Phragmites australis]|uniref:protein SHORTAGE IN CHIASMATA 1 homolog n=1 Tax=Phragmites australis TaxID=29695 RepID=UPI002D768845|nr:protein SHORTAGE IN CHIASMATA 1 homolog [Phragmites australis]
MRARFLATDYFAPSPSAAAAFDQALALASLPFPSLPVPNLPPDHHLPAPFPFPADFLPAASVAGDDLDSLPVATALSEFLAAIIPRPLPVPHIPAADEGLDDYLYDRGGNGKGFSSTEHVALDIPKGLNEICCEKSEKEEGSGSEASDITKRWELLKELRFEVIEVDILPVLQSKIASLGGEESDGGVTLSFGVPDVKIHLDFIDIDTETTITYPAELTESIYQVEKIPVKHDDDEDCSYARDGYCLEIAGLDPGIIIPQLEVSRNSWELDECPTKAAISNIFLNIIEHLNDGAQVHHPAFDSTEFLKSCDMDMLAFVCEDVPRVDYRADKPITAKAVAEMDLVRINDNILVEKKSALYPLKPDGTCSRLPCSILLEEVEIIDDPSDDVFKMLVQSDKAEMNTSDEIFKDDFNPARRFYESVVSSELALVDDTFKSLPTPILTDDKAMRSLLPPIEEVLCSLKPLPLSAADEIYLDWHLISEGPCNREICSTYASMVEEVKPCSLSSELQISSQQISALDIDFLEDFQRSAKLQHEDKQNELNVPVPIFHDTPANLKAAQKHRQESDSRGHSHRGKPSSEKASSLFESVSQSNDLNFYLNVRNGNNKVKTNKNVATLDIPSSKQQAVPFSTRPKVEKLIEIHPVGLSDLIRGLIKDIHLSYTSAFRESVYFRHSFSDGQDLSISKQKLLELITGEGSEGLLNHCKNEDKMELIVLYALKQVAYYLCFFGLHAAHLYIGNLTGSFENIPGRLRNIQCCIGDARLKAEKQLFESHPSLSDIETILRSNAQIGQKILIVADRAFWLPLGQKLTSMKITFVELGKYPSAIYSDPVSKRNSKTWVLEELWKSDCILLDNKNIPASFPFSEFDIILEYGCPNKSSTLLSLAPKLDGLPPLHFLYVKVDGDDFPVALLEDNHTDQDLKSTLDAVLHTLQKDLQEKMNKMRIVDSLNFIPATNQLQHLEEKLSKHLTADSSKKIHVDGQLHDQGNLDEKNIVDSHNFVPAAEQLNTSNQITLVNSQIFVPAVEKSSSTSSVSANVMIFPQDNQSDSDFPLNAKIDSTKSGILSADEVVIVVNTRNHGKNMIFSRRSSYQQILGLEKGGMQVVERDVDLPVDLILSAAVCLLWYDTRTLGYSELTISEETSGITNFIEDIATNILMSLSFPFSGCIMVFEGENHFLSAVMEASYSLYASAASLDMNLQLFFSQMPKSTDQIILNCIRNAARINQAPSPDISESESLAESFLMAFPSINPLSAHMILSSSTIVDFLSWSHEQRTQAIEKYLLPPQSISLFSALCKFGELGESRSVMTECSSLDSDISSALLQSPKKKKKRAMQDFSVAVNAVCPNPLIQLCDYVERDNVFSPPKLRKFSHMEDAMPELPEVFIVNQSLNMGSEGVSYQPRNHDINAISGNQMIDDDFINGLTPNLRTCNERTSSMVDTCNFSWQSELGAEQPIKSSFPKSRPSLCRTYSHPIFPTALEINNNPGDWDISCGANQTWKGHIHGDFATRSCRNDLGGGYHESREQIMQNPASSLAFLKQDFGCHGTSQGSGWEIDYLRQMNEKSRACRERSRCNASATLSNSRMRDGSSRILSAPPIESFRYQRNVDTPLRNQSPSNGAHRYGPIESLRYQRNIDTPLRGQSPSNGAHKYGKGREGTKAQSHRVRKDFKVQPSINHEKSIVPSIEPTWTPVDKRARQKLSFATYGKEKQSKLVWRHQSSPGVGCGSRKRYREEGT